jgi:hypothetical protein
MTKYLALFLLIATVPAAAQTPYAGMQARTVKAFSEQQVADLRAGRGMGLALAAELNGYPGPSHVLELADKLELSNEQRTRVKAMFESMRQEAIPLGVKLIDQEAALDRQFATRAVTATTLKAAVAEIAMTQGELREAHLKYHLMTLNALTEIQQHQYNVLRGYSSGMPHHRHHQTR